MRLRINASILLALNIVIGASVAKSEEFNVDLGAAVQKFDISASTTSSSGTPEDNELSTETNPPSYVAGPPEEIIATVFASVDATALAYSFVHNKLHDPASPDRPYGVAQLHLEVEASGTGTADSLCSTNLCSASLQIRDDEDEVPSGANVYAKLTIYADPPNGELFSTDEIYVDFDGNKIVLTPWIQNGVQGWRFLYEFTEVPGGPKYTNHPGVFASTVSTTTPLDVVKTYNDLGNELPFFTCKAVLNNSVIAAPTITYDEDQKGGAAISEIKAVPLN